MIVTDSMRTIMSKADIYDESVENKVYCGFQRIGGLTSEAIWSILEIHSDPDTQRTTYKWANGMRNNDLVFDDFDTYDYKFKNY